MSCSPLLTLDFQIRDAADHHIGGRLPDAARIIRLGIDARHVPARRDGQRIARQGIIHDQPGVVDGSILGVVQLPLVLDVAEAWRAASRARTWVEDCKPVFEVLALGDQLVLGLLVRNSRRANNADLGNVNQRLDSGPVAWAEVLSDKIKRIRGAAVCAPGQRHIESIQSDGHRRRIGRRLIAEKRLRHAEQGGSINDGCGIEIRRGVVEGQAAETFLRGAG